MLSTYTTFTCTNYISTTTTGSGTCKLAGTGATSVCYEPKSDCTYTHNITGTDDAKTTECKKYVNTKNDTCTYDTGTTCSN